MPPAPGLGPIAGLMDRHYTLHTSAVLGDALFTRIGLALIIIFGALVVLAFFLAFFSSPPTLSRAEQPDPERQPILSPIEADAHREDEPR